MTMASAKTVLYKQRFPLPAKEKRMQLCDIFPVPEKGGFQWKWRARLANGTCVESSEKYPLYFDCVTAARGRGYEPSVKCLGGRNVKSRETRTA